MLTNAIYVYIMIMRKTSVAERNSTVGTMLGFCCAFAIIEVLCYGTLDILPLLLVVMYTFACYKTRTVERREMGGNTLRFFFESGWTMKVRRIMQSLSFAHPFGFKIVLKLFHRLGGKWRDLKF